MPSLQRSAPASPQQWFASVPSLAGAFRRAAECSQFTAIESMARLGCRNVGLAGKGVQVPFIRGARSSSVQGARVHRTSSCVVKSLARPSAGPVASQLGLHSQDSRASQTRCAPPAASEPEVQFPIRLVSSRCAPAEARTHCLSSATAHHRKSVQATFTASRVLPNPSLNRSSNGRPPGPVWRYAVHFRQSGPGVLPLQPG